MMIMMFLMMGGLLIVPLLLIGAVVVAATGFRPKFNLPELANTSQNPLEILEERYARGELTQAEYEQVCRDLEG